MENKDLKLLIRQYSSYKDKIHFATSLSRDLKINGQKGVDFIHIYAKQFNIDISRLDVDKYFPQNEDTTRQKSNKQLTFQDLEKGIIAGELNDEIIELEDNDPNLPLKFTAKNTILSILFIIIVSTILGFIATYV